MGVVSTAGHEKPCGKLGRPRSKAKYSTRPIVDKYREGKVKSPPARGVKEFLKPSAYRQREGGRVRRLAVGHVPDRVPIEE